MSGADAARFMAGHFAEFAGPEMGRLLKDVVGRRSRELHRRLLLRHIRTCDRVPEFYRHRLSRP